ncbi:MAG: DUF1800 domain-containing protein [Pyrinomonadaceae bacterium MAG19_C2-C3]|nr:DUF1800 domain-containing protein [Pyrinomonadaceae bacterium MAG19_C2-C3]
MIERTFAPRLMEASPSTAFAFLTLRAVKNISLVCLLVCALCHVAQAQTGDAPVLLSRANSTRAVAIDYASGRGEPFGVTGRTKTRDFRNRGAVAAKSTQARIVLYAMNVRRFPDENASAFTAHADANASDGTRLRIRLPVVQVNQVAGKEWMTSIVVTVPNELANVGDALIQIAFRGVGSNRVRVGFGRIGGGLPDDAGARPTPAPTTPPVVVPPTINPYTGAQPVADTVRFLEQATFGATPELIARVSANGFQAYLDEQFNSASSDYPALEPRPLSSADYCTAEAAIPNCFRDNYTMFPVQVRFFQNALRGEDQLRQRVAFALSQIFVVSGVDIEQPSSMSPFARVLLRNSFGNFRTLMEDVTLNPAMGRYLDMVNNDKPNPARGIEPNENYARELLQLFTIGLYQLNLDGTLKLDASGKAIPTYDQETVEGFANVFTGWTYATKPGATPITRNPQYYLEPMIPMANNHSTIAKELLDGVVIPATAASASNPNADLQIALDNIFNHPNVAPFTAKHLIQKLVTGNPTPAYVRRVAQKFNDNGAGVRGDMKAVITAILFDPEARGDIKNAPDYGKLREPTLFVTSILRLFNATSDGIGLVDQTGGMGQRVFQSPSVFNFFSPFYKIPATDVTAPEFGIHNTNTTLYRSNFVHTMTYDRIRPSTLDAGATGTIINFAAWEALAANPANLVNELDRTMLHGSMTPAMRDLITRTVTNMTTTTASARAKTAIYLVATSPHYAIQR